MERSQKSSTTAAVLAAILFFSPGTAEGRAGLPDRDWAGEALGNAVERPLAGGAVSTDDLLSLRDIVAMSLSPDGRWIAFSVRQASVRDDDYATRWFIVPAGGGMPAMVDVDGGSPIRYRSSESAVPMAAYADLPPRWSADSRKFAFRRQVGDRIELWVVDAASRRATRLFLGVPQVDAYAWSGDVLVFRTGLDAEFFARSVEEEARHGWLVDARIPLNAGRTPRPLPPICATTARAPGCDVRTLAVTATGEVRTATRKERGALATASGPPVDLPEAGRGGLASASSEGRLVYGEALDRGWRPRRRLAIEHAAPCANALCVSQNWDGVGWSRNGMSVWLARRFDGSSHDGTDGRGPFDSLGIIEWTPGGAARVVRRADDRLSNCDAHGATLFCLQSSALQPPRIVAINLDTGVMHSIADPNPTFASKSFPVIRTVTLTDDEGNQGFARLVLPLGFRPETAYPLVVTTYRAGGFLRGATGDEYPILPLAAEGFLVLSVDAPEDWPGRRELDLTTYLRREREGQRAMRLLTGAIERAVDELIAEGLVKRNRVAITGLSWGAMATHYALQNSDRYAAAIVSAGAADISYLALIPTGPARNRELQITGATSVVPLDPTAYNLARAWSQRPNALRAPLLINAGDGELHMGLEGVSALQQAGRPVEMRVYPDEGHTKFHPRAFAGLYETNLMWLRFWLLGIEDSRQEFAAQFDRWRAMRAALGGLTSEVLSRGERPGFRP